MRAPAEPAPADAAASAAADPRLDRWRERSRRVRTLRVALPAAIAALVAGVVAWIGISSLLADLRTVKAAQGGLHMTNPRFFGRDEGGRAFSLQATEAVRDARDLDHIALTKPNVILDHGAEAPVTAHSPTGLYRESARKLLLTGGVALDDGKGTHLYSPSAEVDTRTGDVDGRGNVWGDGPLGQMQGAAYLVRQKGAAVTFYGGTHAHILNGSETPRP